jgi:hypothetical protein
MLELLGDDGKQGANGSASASSADDVKLTVQLVDALAHTGDTHAQRDLRGSVGNHVVDTNSVIFDFHPHGIRVAFDADTGGSGAGMAVHVGERLLHNPKNRQLEARVEAAKVIGDFGFHRAPTAFGEEFGVGAQGGDQSGLLQHRWMQKGSDKADFANRVTGQAGGGFHQFVNLAVAAWDGAADLAEGHF